MQERVEKTLSEIARLCVAGLDARTLRARTLPHLRRVVPFACAWFATADPETLLFTGGLSDAIPPSATPLFLANELFHDDVGKFSALARLAAPLETLFRATEGKPERSRRYREILRPFGMGDELRVALREGGRCWGYLCLHRELEDEPFHAQEADALLRLAPQLAAGLRNAVLIRRTAERPAPETPALVVLNEDLSFSRATASGERWLEELADHPPWSRTGVAIAGVAAQLIAGGGPAASVRVRSRAGHWLTVHATRLGASGEIAVILEPMRPAQEAPLLLSAYLLTERERTVAQQVIRGLSNKAIARALSVSPLTVQQHLKAVFEKVGVHSRGELMAHVLGEATRTPER